MQAWQHLRKLGFRMAAAIQIDLLRHGACEGGEIFRGHTDVALSQLGWRQMRHAVSNYREDWQGLWCSPLQRCHLFAQEVAQSSAIDIAVHDGFREISFGDWDGRLREELQKQQADALDAFYRDPLNHAPPNGESLQQFSDRVIDNFVSQVLQAQQEKILLVSHGGTMRAILCWALGVPLQNFFRIDVPYATISRLRIYRDGDKLYPQLISHNANDQVHP